MGAVMKLGAVDATRKRIKKNKKLLILKRKYNIKIIWRIR